MKMMLLSKIKVTMAMLVVGSALAAGGTGLAYRAQADEPSRRRDTQRADEPPASERSRDDPQRLIDKEKEEQLIDEKKEELRQLIAKSKYEDKKRNAERFIEQRLIDDKEEELRRLVAKQKGDGRGTESRDEPTTAVTAAQEGGGPEASKPDPRAVAERYLAAALAGRAEDAVGLAVDGRDPSKKVKVEDLKALVDAKVVTMKTVWVGQKREEALAVSEPVKATMAQPDGREEGLFLLWLVESQGKWQVNEIDFRTVDWGEELVKRFRIRNLDAKELSANPGG
ncbi:MAG TPA: hypothetical protein VF590_06390 [Isosphaeraceae bacterium]|jgi:hypothetical protein